MVMYQQTKINNIIIDDYIVSWEYERTYGDAISQISLVVTQEIQNVLTLGLGTRVEVWRGWVTATDEKIFDGYIESFDPDGGTINIVSKDKMWDLVRKEVTEVYDINTSPEAGVISDIFLDLVTTYGGLNADGTTVQDTGTLVVLDKYVCNHDDIMERCQYLAEVFDYVFYYRADTDKVYFEPKGYTANSTILTVGNNIIEVPEWTYDVAEMVNSLTVIGASQEIETTELGQIGVTAGYTTTGVTLAYTPVSVKVYSDVANPPTTLKVGGLPDSTSSYYYYVDVESKKILPKPSTTFTTNNYFETRYSHDVPIPVTMYSQPSIDAYGEFAKTITFEDLRTVADAETRGNEYLIKYSTPFQYSTLKVENISTYDLKVGQTIQVVDTINNPNVNKVFFISRVRIRYPDDYVEILVGDKTYRLAEWTSSVEIRLKRAAELQLQNQDIVTNVINIDNSLLQPIEVVPRYFLAETQSVVTGSMVWGISLWGTPQVWGGSWNPAQNAVVQQYQNIYTERFLDNDFDDSSTATWNTSTNQLTFTAGQVGKSLPVDYNNGTITSARMTATISSGTFLLEATADGTNWETMTNGVIHNFSNTGTDLRWRITENGASTGTITQVVLNNYH